MASSKKWSPIDFVIISGLVVLAATTVNWFAGLGFEPLDKLGAMMFQTKGSQYTQGYESYGIDLNTASPACRGTLQGAADAKVRLRGEISKAEAAGDTGRLAELNARIVEIDNNVRSACGQ